MAELDGFTKIHRTEADESQAYVGVKDASRSANDSTVSILLSEFETLETKVTQTAHGFTAGDIIRSSGTDGEFTKAQADTEANANALGIVLEVPDANTFVYQHVVGSIIVAAAAIPAGAAGTVWYLDQSTPGAVTSAEPSSGLRKPLFVTIADGAAALWINRPTYGGDLYGQIQDPAQTGITEVGTLQGGSEFAGIPVGRAHGGSGTPMTPDPSGDRLVMFKNSSGNWEYAILGTNLSFSGNTLNAAGGSSGMNYQGGYDASTNTPDLDTAPSGVTKGDVYTVTAAGQFFTAEVGIGDTLIAEIDNASAEADWTIVQANIEILDEDNFASDDPAHPPSQQSTKAYVDAEVLAAKPIEERPYALSGQDEDAATGTKLTFHLMDGFELESDGVMIGCNGDNTGAAIIVDVQDDGVSILTTKPQIAAGDNTSNDGGSSVAAVLSSTTLAAGSKISVVVDQVGSSAAGTGLKLYLKGRRI